MHFQISILLLLLATCTTIIALPFHGSSLDARALTKEQKQKCPDTQTLVKEAQNTPVTKGLYWTGDASQCYRNYAKKYGLTILRDLWSSKQVDIWSDSDERCFNRLSQAFAQSTQGEVIMVTAPDNTEEKGLHWARVDPYWLGDELPILTDPRKGHKVKKITRVNLKKIAEKRGNYDCEEISSEVVWKEGDAVYVHHS